MAAKKRKRRKSARQVRVEFLVKRMLVSPADARRAVDVAMRREKRVHHKKRR